MIYSCMPLHKIVEKIIKYFKVTETQCNLLIDKKSEIIPILH